MQETDTRRVSFPRRNETEGRLWATVSGPSQNRSPQTGQAGGHISVNGVGASVPKSDSVTTRK